METIRGMKKQSLIAEFAKYVFPNVMGMTGLSCYILADTFFVSRGLGTDGLAALNLAIPIYNFINGCGLMIGMGCSTKYAVFRAQQNDCMGNKVFVGALWMGLAAAMCFVIPGLSGYGGIASFMGAEGKVYEMTQTYLKVMMRFSPAYILNNILLCFVRNDGNPRLSMAGMLSGSLANILLDYLFIFPMGMGIFGAVLATGVAPLISIGILSFHIFGKNCGFRIIKTLPGCKLISSAAGLGLPSLITEVSVGMVMILFNRTILGLEGNIGVAAYGVVANIALVVIAIFTGIGQGVQPVISEAYGQKDRERAHVFLKYSIITSTLLAVLLYSCMFLLASQITSVFNSEGNRQLQQTAVQGIKIYFLYAPFAGFNIVLSLFFSSVEKAVPAQIISLLRGFLLIIPVLVLLSGLFGMLGVWLVCPVTETLVAITGVGLLGEYRRGIKAGGIDR